MTNELDQVQNEQLQAVRKSNFEISELSDKNKMLATHVEQLRKNFQNSENHRLTVEMELKETRKKLEKEMNEKEGLKEDIEGSEKRMEDEILFLENERAGLESEMQTIKAENGNLKKNNAKLKGEVEAHVSNIELLKIQVNGKKGEVAQIKAALVEAINEKELIVGENNELRNAERKSNAVAESAEEQLASIENELNRKIEDLNEEISRLLNEIEEQNENLKNLENDYEKACEKNEEYSHELDENEARYESLRKTLENNEQDLLSKLEEVENEKREGLVYIQEMEEKCDILEKNLSNGEDEIEKLKSEEMEMMETEKMDKLRIEQLEIALGEMEDEKINLEDLFRHGIQTHFY